MKTGLKLLALALAGISLSACSTHHQTGSKDGIFSQKSSGSLDTSRRYYDDLVNRYYYYEACLLYTSPSPRDGLLSRMPSSA